MPSAAIACPGSWTFGLDSPERGESRWSQNLARMLAMGGWDVFAFSGGDPTWGGMPEEPNVTLYPQDRIQRWVKGADLYIDSSWWENKEAVVQAKAYLHLHFSVEDRLQQQDFGFGPDHYLAFPFAEHAEQFYRDSPHLDRTLYVPAPLSEMRLPVWPTKHRLLWSTRPPSGGGAENPLARTLIAAIAEARKTAAFEVVWLFSDKLIEAGWLPPVPGPDDVYTPNQSLYGIPYCAMVETLRGVTVNLTAGAPANVPNASLLGIPSLLWGGDTPGGGCWPPAQAIARESQSLLGGGASVETITHMLLRLLIEPAHYLRTAQRLQHIYRDHTIDTCWRRFQHTLSVMGL